MRTTRLARQQRDPGGTPREALTRPMLETEHQRSMYGFIFPNYLAELGAQAQTEVAQHASLGKAMRDAFRKLWRFLTMAHQLSEDEAISLMTVAAEFGVTQVVDANWGVQDSIRKNMFVGK